MNKWKEIKCLLGLHNWDYSITQKYCLNCHKIIRFQLKKNERNSNKVDIRNQRWFNEEEIRQAILSHKLLNEQGHIIRFDGFEVVRIEPFLKELFGEQ